MKLFSRPLLACLPLVAAMTAWSDAPQTQGQATEVVGPTKQLRSEVVLSAEDDAVLHTSFYATGAFTGGEEGQVLSGTRHRVVSLATHVTVGEVWQPSTCHSVMTVNTQGTEEVLLVATYAPPGKKKVSFTVGVSPLIGLTWGMVKDANELHFELR